MINDKRLKISSVLSIQFVEISKGETGTVCRPIRVDRSKYIKFPYLESETIVKVLPFQ